MNIFSLRAAWPKLVASALVSGATAFSVLTTSAAPCTDCELPLRIQSTLQDWAYIPYLSEATLDFTVSTDLPLETGTAAVWVTINCASGYNQRYDLEAFTKDLGGVVVPAAAATAKAAGAYAKPYSVAIGRDTPAASDQCLVTMSVAEAGGEIETGLTRDRPTSAKDILPPRGPQSAILSRSVVYYPAGATLPTVSWSSVPTRATFEAGDDAAFALAASPTAGSGTVDRVEFLVKTPSEDIAYAGVLPSDATAPYELTIDPATQVLDQPLEFIARVVTSGGLARYSTAYTATFIANQPPKIDLRAPLHRNIYRTSEATPNEALVTFDAANIGTTGSLAQTRWTLNGQVMSETQAQFTKSLPVGKYALSLKATDAVGLASEYGPVEFEVSSASKDRFHVNAEETSFNVGFHRSNDDGIALAYASINVEGVLVGADATIRVLPLFGKYPNGLEEWATLGCDFPVPDARGETALQCRLAMFDPQGGDFSGLLESIDPGKYRVRIEVRNGPQDTLTNIEFEADLIGHRTGCAEDAHFCGFRIALDNVARQFDVVAGQPITLRANEPTTVENPTVDFIVDGRVVGARDLTAPYETIWTPTAAVQHRVYARACRPQPGSAGEEICYYTQVAHARVVNATAPEVRIVGSSYGVAPISNSTSWRPTFTAVDRDGTIARVDMLVDGIVLSSDATAPFELPQVKLPVGPRRIEVRATDNQGRTGSDFMTLDVQQVTAAVPVSLAVVRPLFVPPGGTQSLIAKAAVTGAVVRVDFHRNGELIGSDLTAPYEMALPMFVGRQSIVAVAYTAATGIQAPALSTPVNVNLNNAIPQLSLAALPAASLPYPASINLTATVTDDGPISAVEFFAIRTRTGAEPFNKDSREYSLGKDAAAPFVMTWNPEPNFDYLVFARVVDQAGATVDSAPRGISIPSTLANLPAMDIAIIEPLAQAEFSPGQAFRVAVGANRWLTGATAKSVRFLLNDVEIGVDMQEPFEIWTGAATTGQYVIKAIVTDFFDQVQQRQVTVNVVNRPPTITLATFGDTPNFARNAQIVLYADASDSDGSITKVDFFKDAETAPFATLTEEPFETSVAFTTLGAHSVRAVASDNGTPAVSGQSTLNLSIVNTKPTLSWVSPTSDGARYLAPAALTAEVEARDADGSVNSVVFKLDGVVVGTRVINSTRFAADLSNIAAGTHSIEVKATDNDGGDVPVSRSIVVVTNTTPTISFIRPIATQAPYTRGDSISIEVAVSDTESAFAPVEYVQLLVDGVLKDTDLSPPYTFEVPAPTATGTHVLRAVAKDRAFAPQVERTISVINSVPTVSWNTPAAGQIFVAPATINASVTASDRDGAISSVVFKLNGASPQTDTSAPFTASWPNISTPIGALTLTATAYDNEPTPTPSAEISRSVTLKSNSPPAAAMSAPTGAPFFVGDTINLSATVTDVDTDTSAVAFYRRTTATGIETKIDNGQRVGTTSQWTYAWTNVPATGTAANDYYLFARATDAVGGASVDSTNAVIKVVTNTAPDVLSHLEYSSTTANRCTETAVNPRQTYPTTPRGIYSFIVREGEQRTLCARVFDAQQNVSSTKFYLSRSARQGSNSLELPGDAVLLGTAPAPTGGYSDSFVRVMTPLVTIPSGFTGGTVVYIWIVASDTRITGITDPKQIEVAPIAVVAPNTVPIPCLDGVCAPGNRHVITAKNANLALPELHLEAEHYDAGGQGLGYFDTDGKQCTDFTIIRPEVEVDCQHPDHATGPEDASGSYVRMDPGEYLLSSVNVVASGNVKITRRQWFPMGTKPTGLICPITPPSGCQAARNTSVAQVTAARDLSFSRALDTTADAALAVATSIEYEWEDPCDCANTKPGNNWYKITESATSTTGALIPAGDLYFHHQHPISEAPAYIDWFEFNTEPATSIGKSGEFITPTNNSSFGLGRPVTFSLAAFGTEGSTVSVRYLFGPTGSVTSPVLTAPPYEYVYTPASGTTSYRAEITFTPIAGGTPTIIYVPDASSAPNTLNVYPSPTVQLMTTSQTVSQGGSINLVARATCGSATDPLSAVAEMQFNVNGATFRQTSGTTLASPACTKQYEWPLSNLAASAQPLVVTARAVDGRTVLSDLSPAIALTVQAAPAGFVATMATPTTTYTSPANVTLSSTVVGIPAGSAISKVEYFNGTQKVGADGNLTAPYSAAWNNVGPGNYAITVKVTAGTHVIVSPPLAIKVDSSGNETYYFHHTNLQGSVVATTNDRGQLVAATHYRPFGIKQANTAGVPLVRQGFTGKPEDTDLGLIYFGARYYDPQLSRFTSIDPVDFLQNGAMIGSDSMSAADPASGGMSSSGNFNRYAYANNSPMAYGDLDGRWASKWGFYVHQRAIHFTIGQEVSYRDNWVLKQSQVLADSAQFQTGDNAFRHAMSSGKQTPEEGRAAANQFVRDQFQKAWRAPNRKAALTEFGLALHTLQDATSPAHQGFQRWTGEESKAREGWHAAKELFGSSELRDVTQQAWEWYQTRTLPDGDLFYDRPQLPFMIWNGGNPNQRIWP